MPAGLAVAGYLPRADTHDVLVVRQGVSVPRTIATGSPRRRLQVARLFPGVTFTEIRGNVDTRLKKIAEQKPAVYGEVLVGLDRVIAGEHDFIYEGQWDRAHALLDQVAALRSRTLIKGAGHWVSFEAADRYNAIVLDLLKDPPHAPL